MTSPLHSFGRLVASLLCISFHFRTSATPPSLMFFTAVLSLTALLIVSPLFSCSGAACNGGCGGEMVLCWEAFFLCPCFFFFSVSADGVLCNSNCATVSVVSCLISDYHLCPMRIPFRSRLCH